MRGERMRWGRRMHRRGRSPKDVAIGVWPACREFTPGQGGDQGAVELTPREIEALRLVDLEDLSQEEAGERMGVSRGTIWRTLKEARRKVAEALVYGRAIRVAAED